MSIPYGSKIQWVIADRKCQLNTSLMYMVFHMPAIPLVDQITFTQFLHVIFVSYIIFDFTHEKGGEKYIPARERRPHKMMIREPVV